MFPHVAYNVASGAAVHIELDPRVTLKGALGLVRDPLGALRSALSLVQVMDTLNSALGTYYSIYPSWQAFIIGNHN